MFGERLKMARKNKHLLQRDLAKAVGVGASAVSNWEKGVSTPDYATLCKIASLLGVSLNYLLDFDIDSEAKEIAKIRNQNLEVLDNDAKNSIYDYALDWQQSDNVYGHYSESLDKSDKVLVESMKDFSDAFLQKELLSAFRVLSRRGKIEAFERVSELQEISRFRNK